MHRQNYLKFNSVTYIMARYSVSLAVETLMRPGDENRFSGNNWSKTCGIPSRNLMSVFPTPMGGKIEGKRLTSVHRTNSDCLFMPSDEINSCKRLRQTKRIQCKARKQLRKSTCFCPRRVLAHSPGVYIQGQRIFVEKVRNVFVVGEAFSIWRN